MSIMKMVYQSGLNNGLSPNQARAFTAEVGRENDFNPSFIFGEHRDSNRDNVGIISWNQGRRSNLYNYLQKRGISTKNGIERSQRALDAQMGFAIHEMKTNPAYKATKRIFLDNPNVDYRTAEKVLGKNFIRWDYAGNSLGAKVKAHHNKRDKYYAQLGGKDFGQQQQQAPDPRLSMSAPDLLASLRKSKGKRSDNEIFIELANNNGLAGREINHLLSQGANPQSIAQDLGLKVSIAQQPQAMQSDDDFPQLGTSYEEYMSGVGEKSEPEQQLPEMGNSYEEYMEGLQAAEQPQQEAQLPDMGGSYEEYMSGLNLSATEQPTQAGDTWQTQNELSKTTSSPNSARAQQPLKSSWELPS